MKSSVALLIVAVAGAVQSASAQATPAAPPRQMRSCDRDSTGTGSIVGQLISNSPGISLTRAVYNEVSLVRSAPDGRFALRGLSPGDYHVAIGDLGVRRVRPIKVTVVAGRTDTIEIRLRLPDPVLDCADEPRCAPLLEPATADLTEIDKFRELAYRTAIAITFVSRDTVTPPIYCLRGVASDSDRVLIVLKSRVPTVRRESACERTSERGKNVRERETGREGWFIGIDPPQVSATLQREPSVTALDRCGLGAGLARTRGRAVSGDRHGVS